MKKSVPAPAAIAEASVPGVVAAQPITQPATEAPDGDSNVAEVPLETFEVGSAAMVQLSFIITCDSCYVECQFIAFGSSQPS